AGIPAVTVDHRAFADRPSFDAAVVEALRAHGVEVVVLAGFMRLVTDVLLGAFPMRFVNGGTDTGPIIAQSTVPVLDGDDEAALTKRILAAEHALLPRVLQWMAEGRVAVTREGPRPRVRVREG